MWWSDQHASGSNWPRPCHLVSSHVTLAQFCFLICKMGVITQMLNLAYNKYSINIDSLSSYVLLHVPFAHELPQETHTYTHNSHFMYEDFIDFINSPNIRNSGMSLCNFQQLKFGKEHTNKRNNVQNYSKSQSSVCLFERNGPCCRNSIHFPWPYKN